MGLYHGMKQLECILKNRSLGSLLHWLRKNALRGATVALHPLCCNDLKALLYAFECKIVYLDICKTTLCISKDSIKNCTEAIDVFLNVRTLGYEGDMASLFLYVKQKYPQSLIVDDRCLCRPLLYNGAYNLPENVDAEMYSTGYSKYIDIGFGGYLIHNKPAKDHSITFESSKISVDLDGKLKDVSWVDDRNLNHAYYFDHVNALLPLVSRHKENLNAIYQMNLSRNSAITILRDHTDWRFNILCEDPESIQQSIFEKGLFCSKHYQADLIGNTGCDCPNANSVANKILNLFNDFRFSDDNANLISGIING